VNKLCGTFLYARQLRATLKHSGENDVGQLKLPVSLSGRFLSTIGFLMQARKVCYRFILQKYADTLAEVFMFG
jgi:hypothetical protein